MAMSKLVFFLDLSVIQHTHVFWNVKQQGASCRFNMERNPWKMEQVTGDGCQKETVRCVALYLTMS